MLGISKDSYTDLLTNEKKDSIYLRLYLSAFKEGLVAKLTGNQLKVLLTIASYMNEDGECYPTQEQIAERSGIALGTANKAVKDLLDMEFNGKPLLSREIVHKGYFKNSMYKVNPISQVAIFGGEVENITNTGTDTSTKVSTKNDTKFATAKQVGELYMAVFKEVYGVSPSLNYARDYSQVKKKWIGHFTDEQIEEMVTVGIQKYDELWKSQKFPRPSLSALVSWIGEQALGLASDNKKDFEEVSEITKDYVAVNDNALNRLANRLNKG
ncbi:helix-turn-helix domain-containing protein [Cytobacillus firmus]|nr:helix-turn-helix domain-containing protein [Cytobacillus firmus]